VGISSGGEIAMSAGEQYRPDRVYITTNLKFARFMAQIYRNGSVYEVEPVGNPEPDPSQLRDAWTCGAVRIIQEMQVVV
jgi:hypothetical protein